MDLAHVGRIAKSRSRSEFSGGRGKGQGQVVRSYLSLISFQFGRHQACSDEFYELRRHIWRGGGGGDWGVGHRLAGGGGSSGWPGFLMPEYSMSVVCILLEGVLEA